MAAELTELTLGVAAVDVETDEYEEGTIIGQAPAAMSLQRGGITVTVEVAVAPDLPTLVEMPGVVGLSEAEARGVLAAAGLGVAVFVEPFFDEELERFGRRSRRRVAAVAGRRHHRRDGQLRRDLGEHRTMTASEPDTPAAAGANDGAGATPVRRRWRMVGRWLAGLFVVGSFVFWAWAFSPWARTENPARLDDREFAQWADQRCAHAQAAIAEVPTARQAASREERADQVDRGTDEVESLVDDLRMRAQVSLATSTERDGPPDADLVRDWLADWDVYVTDRRSHSAKLRTADDDTPDRELRFLLVDMTEGSTYTERMDGFSRLNNMDNCQVPGDV